MKNGFFRAAAVVPEVIPGDVVANTDQIIKQINDISAEDADLLVFPEMSITGYTCADLFFNFSLLDATLKAIDRIADATAEPSSPLVIVGAPLALDGCLYNCAIAIRGRVLAVIPKTFIPNYNEFYEKRWWTAAPADDIVWHTEHWGDVPFGTHTILNHCGTKIAVEICEDLWTPIPPSSHAALAGAEIIANLSASNDIVGKYEYVLDLVRQQSSRCLAAYIYASAGFGESSTDLVFDGKALIAEKGTMLAHNKRWSRTAQHSIVDIDLEAIRHDRLIRSSWADSVRFGADIMPEFIHIDCGHRESTRAEGSLLRHITPTPFVPADDEAFNRHCDEIINIQIAGLARRLKATNCRNLVIGISGGLDSTLALLIAVKTFDALNIPRTGIHGITMPGFGTSDRTYQNALKLMQRLGISTREISIVPAVKQHFADINHDIDNHDVTYENSQARERTQILMDIANQVGGMVLGTGDLSELALGWATYNGDHMSMYGINASVPKTLVRRLTQYIADNTADADIAATLYDVIGTPISPELIPTDAKGDINQKTEDLVGPYELHDFFLYYILRYGFTPRRIFLLARKAFAGRYDDATIKHWLTTFVRRFFSQQFKRSCLPDGPKVGSVCLSPRGDWRMPSDASAKLWLDECQAL